MGSVGKAIGSIFGGDDQAAALRKQQAEQQDQIDAANRANDAVLAGQRAVSSGGNGFLSYIDDQLKKTFGG